MRKMSKILFMLSLILMLVFSYTSISNAAANADYTGYEELADELGDDTNNNEETKTETSTEKEEPETPKATEETKKDVANKSTQPHTQAGSFETKAIVSTGVVVLALAGVGYIKYKKYNF